MKLRNRLIKSLFPPRHWHVNPPSGFPKPCWWLEGRSRLGRRYNVGPFFDLDEAIAHCAQLNGLRA